MQAVKKVFLDADPYKSWSQNSKLCLFFVNIRPHTLRKMWRKWKRKWH